MLSLPRSSFMGLSTILLLSSLAHADMAGQLYLQGQTTGTVYTQQEGVTDYSRSIAPRDKWKLTFPATLIGTESSAAGRLNKYSIKFDGDVTYAVQLARRWWHAEAKFDEIPTRLDEPLDVQFEAIVDPACRNYPGKAPLMANTHASILEKDGDALLTFPSGRTEKIGQFTQIDGKTYLLVMGRDGMTSPVDGIPHKVYPFWSLMKQRSGTPNKILSRDYDDSFQIPNRQDFVVLVKMTDCR